MTESKTPVRDGLAAIYQHQHGLQAGSFGIDPALLEGDERIEYIRWNVLALEDELHEALAETGWKPWASSNHVNDDAFTKELIDALHFLLNLFIVAGCGPDEIYDRYMAKAKVNAKRQERGYDGVLDKCPHCRRELDGPESVFIALNDDGENQGITCEACKGVLSPTDLSWL